jgi:predicted metal-dependent peptidase
MALELSKLRAKLFLKDSFIACVAGQLDWTLTEEVTQTAATDGTHIYINEEFFNKLSLAEQLGVIAHEALHVILMHTVRARQITDLERHAWNVACDMCVNRELEHAKFVLPEGKVECSSKYMDMTTEEIYQDLLKKNGKGQGNSKSSGGNCSNNGNSSENQNEGYSGSSDVLPTQSQKDVNKVKQTINKSVIMTAKKEWGAGTNAFSRELQKRLEEINRPTLPWPVLLRKYINDTIKDDWSWARPNRRVQEVYLPSLSGESGTLGHINVYIDNSGSVTDRQVANFIREIEAIHKSMSPRSTTISFFSNRITNSYKIGETWDISKIDPYTTGGTDITPVIGDIIEKKPAVSIVFTDGYFDDYSDRTKLPIIWCIFDNSCCRLKHGKIIYMKEV